MWVFFSLLRHLTLGSLLLCSKVVEPDSDLKLDLGVRVSFHTIVPPQYMSKGIMIILTSIKFKSYTRPSATFSIILLVLMNSQALKDATYSVMYRIFSVQFEVVHKMFCNIFLSFASSSTPISLTHTPVYPEAVDT